MESFSDFITERKNTHMTHVEDLVIYGGVDGTRQAINALRDMRDLLSGSRKGKISVKWDGAPAIFCGTDPRDGRFFVAKKGIFNKNPKVYKTPAEVDADTSGDLASKLKDALRYLPELGIKGVVQGDFLFSNNDLKKQTIDGNDYITFHPNTIVYSVPVEQAQPLLKSKIGIVWHTTYTGNTFEDMKADFGVNVKSFKKTKNVWSQDAMMAVQDNVTMTAKETKEINKYLSQIGKLFNQTSGNTLRELEANEDLSRMIETYNNTFVRAGRGIPNSSKHVDGLIKWIHDKFEKEADKRKTQKGKDVQYKKREELLKFFSTRNKANLVRMFELQKLMVYVKNKLIQKLNYIQRVKTFVRTPNGFKTTGAEGFVAIDKLSGGAVKLVDRLEFSYNNFSPDIIKGWQSSSRN